MKFTLIILAIYLLASSVLFGQEFPKRTYTTNKLETKDVAPSIDGVLNDPAWKSVDWENEFVQPG